MKEKVAVVVTTINEPTAAMRQLAAGCIKHGYDLVVIGDESGPGTFDLEGCRFYSLKEQRESGLRVAELCPTRQYVRKNIGYLLARQRGATVITETDDDNLPYESFWTRRSRRQNVPALAGGGFVNVYRYFTDTYVWPRGFPLQNVKEPVPPFAGLASGDVDCPIQQSPCNTDPDVDAIFRLTQPLPVTFRTDRRVALGSGSWCPFNSQNTTWESDAFPLLYLPVYYPLRSTDIWRSFVAQRIAWANGWSVLFHEPTTWQERNQHVLIRDFENEIPGYLHDKEICNALEKLSLKAGVEHIPENLLVCYEELVRIGTHDPKELNLLAAWLDDIRDVTGTLAQTQAT
jgi:hypothetical protein